MLSRLKINKFRRHQQTFSYRYNHCNRCSLALDIEHDEEIVCALCGETFCKNLLLFLGDLLLFLGELLLFLGE